MGDLYTREDFNKWIVDRENNKHPFCGVTINKEFLEDTYKTSVIYFLICDDSVVYVGQTKRLLARIAEHLGYGKEFDSFMFVKVKEEDMDFLENALIILLKPKLNEQRLRKGFVDIMANHNYEKLINMEIDEALNIMEYLKGLWLYPLLK